MAKKKKSSKALQVVKKQPNQAVLVAGKKRHGKVGASPFAAASSKKSSKAAMKAALDQKHTMTAVGAAAAMGYLEGNGSLASVPKIEALGKTGTLAVVAFIAAKMTKNPTLDHIATGLGAVAAYDLAFNAAKPEGSPGRVSGTYDALGGSEFEEW